MTTTILSARWIVSGVNNANKVDIHENAALVFKNNKILEVNSIDKIKSKYPDAKIKNYSNHMIIPGLVNSHHHIGLTPLQLGAPDYSLELWFAARLAMRKIDPYLDTMFSAFEMIESGVTTVQHIQGWATGNYDEVVNSASSVLRAYDDIGLRVSYSYAVREQNRFVYEADQEFCNRLPPKIAKIMSKHFAQQTLQFDDFINLFDHLRANNKNPKARIQLAPANLHWMTDDGIIALKEKASNEGVPMHMHLLETPYQKEYAFKRTGTTAVKHLNDLKVLGPHMTLGHGVWMTEEDIEICADTGTCICHNCSSNFRLRSGMLPLMELQKRGVVVGMGMDEAGINDDRDMLQEMRMALTVHRTPGMIHNDVPTPAQILKMATEHGAHTTAFGTEIGRLDPGRKMDAVVINYHKATYPFQDEDIPPLDALIHRAKTKDIKEVFIDGQTVYKDGLFVNVNKDEILEAIHKAMEKPRDEDEIERHFLRKEVFPIVEEFYSNYIIGTKLRSPFYKNSSSS